MNGCVGVSVGGVRGGGVSWCASGVRARVRERVFQYPRPDPKDSMVKDIITPTLIHSQIQFPTHTCRQSLSPEMRTEILRFEYRLDAGHR